MDEKCIVTTSVFMTLIWRVFWKYITYFTKFEAFLGSDKSSWSIFNDFDFTITIIIFYSQKLLKTTTKEVNWFLAIFGYFLGLYNLALELFFFIHQFFVSSHIRITHFVTVYFYVVVVVLILIIASKKQTNK